MYRTVNARALDGRTSVILHDFGRYFEEVPDCEVIPLTREFYTWFSTVAHRNLSAEDLPIYRRIFEECSREPDQSAKDMLVAKLLEADLAVRIADITDRWTRGEEVDIGKVLRSMVDEHETQVRRKVTMPFVDMDQDLFADDVNNIGFKWRLACLNMAMRPMRSGDFIIVAARPDKGKTTFLTDNLTHMVHQIPEVYADDATDPRTILWFNNEGPGARIVKRAVQSALNAPISRLVELSQSGTMWASYEAAIGASRLRLRIMDVHGFRSWQIEEILRHVKPAIVVFDMIDNIKFDGELINGGQRTDQMLEAMYQWARELGVRYDTPVIATSQISAEGDGLAYPTLAMLKDSKTGKQGAADAIITIGARNEPAMENIRYIGLTKNKLQLEGRPRSPQAEVVLDGTSGRFVEAQ